MRRLNSAGRCSAIWDQTGSRWRPRPSAEAVVGLLQVVADCVPPDHDVGVGAQSAHVVGPADPTSSSAMLANSPRPRRPGSRSSSPNVPQPEDRPHRVADGLVEVPASLPWLGRALRSWVHSPLRPAACAGRVLGGRSAEAASSRPRPLGGRDARRDAHPVVRRAAHREPGTGTRARIRATRSRCPTAYWGRPPPQRVDPAVDRPAESPIASCRSRRDAADESSSLALQLPLVPCRPTEARSTTRSPSALRPPRAPSPTSRTRRSRP